jgi:hypothetical protein
MLGLMRTFAPGIRPRSGWSEVAGLGSPGGGRTDVRRLARAWCERWGSWPDPSGKLAGSFREAGRILPGSWPDPSGTVRERFEDGSRASGRRKGRQPRPAASALARSRALGERGRRVPWPTDRAAAFRGNVEPVSLHGFMAKPFLGVHSNPARQSPVLSQVQAHPNRFRPPRVNCSFRSDHREDRCTARGRPSPSFPGVIPCGAPRSSPSGAAARDRWHPAAGVARPVSQRGAKSKASRRRRPTRHASRRPPAQSQRHQKN